MKAFDDLTNEELVALSQEQIAHYKRLEAAEAGVVLPGPEPVPFSEQRPSQDVVLYTVMGCKFTSREKAEELQRFLMERQACLVETDYNWQMGSHAHYVKGFEGELAITESSVYSAKRYEELREQINGYSQRKKVADEARAEWQKAKNGFDKCVEWVDGKVSEARARIWKEQENQRRFNEYLELAEGDSRRAWQFFTKANLELVDFRPVGAPPLVVVR